MQTLTWTLIRTPARTESQTETQNTDIDIDTDTDTHTSWRLPHVRLENRHERTGPIITTATGHVRLKGGSKIRKYYYDNAGGARGGDKMKPITRAVEFISDPRHAHVIWLFFAPRSGPGSWDWPQGLALGRVECSTVVAHSLA